LVRSGRRSTGSAAAIAMAVIALLSLGLLSVALSGCSSAAHSAASSSGGSTSTGSGTASPRSPTATTSVTARNAGGSGGCGSSVHVAVSSGNGLQNALSSARPGETIVLAPGTYNGNFVVTQSGTQSAPITLCGPRTAVLSGGDIGSGYVFHLEHASWWHLMDFTITGGQKGVMADDSDHDLLYGLYVHSTGDEGIHLRDFSSHDTISHSLVRDTGLLVPFYGEGIYVGSAHSNWCQYSGCQPDASNDDIITGNNIADTTAENIDIKEGTTGGQIIGNQLNGSGMAESAATAWVNVKGNTWLIADNVGVDSVKDGFQDHKVYTGWGMYNTFRGNRADVNGPGYGFYVQSKHLDTTVACQNTVSNAASGFSSVACA